MIVSLCMIAYNEANAIDGLFKDISLQEYPHEKIEVVFVDSMSTDATHDKMEEFKNTDYGFLDVKIVRCEKHNQAYSWNAALKTATGDLIIRVDAHARIPNNFVSRNVYNIRRGENVVGGGRPNISSNVSSWKLTLLAAEDSLFGSSIAGYRRPASEKEYMDSLFHAAYKREVIRKVGGFNEDLGRTEDNEFHYRIRQAGYKLCCCPDIISYQHSRNTLKNMVRQKYANGKWIGLTVSVCPGCLSSFHFAPFLFVIALLFCIVSAALGQPLMLYILLALYGMFDFVNSVSCFAMKNIQPQFLLLPLIFPLLHISYGLGTVVGLAQIPFWLRKIKNSPAKQHIEEVKQKIAENTVKR
ncbi:MAG: glycosyltransferase family 2 protein [Ruminococcus sp.]|nr:glycosyltransferase family 2 protein [Ruminococcus sp.]